MAAKNPMLRDPEIAFRFQALPEQCKTALRDFCLWLYRHSRKKAEESWKKRKAPMAIYWSSVKAWAFHMYRTVQKATREKPDSTKRDLILKLLQQGPRTSRELSALAGTPRYSARILELRREGYRIERTTIAMNSGNGKTVREHLYALVSSPEKEEAPQNKLFEAAKWRH